MRREVQYQTIAASLLKDIESGKYPPSSSIPAETLLASEYGVSRQTVRQAIAILEQKDLIIRKRGSGTYVKETVLPVRPSSQRTNTVGVISIHSDDEYIFPSVYGGMDTYLSSHGYTGSLTSSRNRFDMERAALLRFLDQNVSGLIVQASRSALPNPNIDLYKKYAQENIPVVFFHCYYPEFATDHIHVVMDDRKGGYEATKYLVEHGHTRIGGIFRYADITGHRRYEGYLHALNQSGIPYDDDRVIWFSNPGRLYLDLPQLFEKCSAVVCFNDAILVEVLRSAAAVGKSVPEELSIISFDDSVCASIASVPATSLAHPKAELGRITAQKLVNLMNGEKEESVVMNWKLVERNSVQSL